MNQDCPAAEKIKKLPRRPGVYLWKDKKGTVIYVGKAKVLANRVRSYAQDPKTKDIKTRLLVVNIHDLDWIVTDTEKEALILENNLIKKYRPQYNIRLRDDKNYMCLRLSTDEQWPKLSIVRRIKNDRATYFGPFSSSRAVRTTLRFLNKHFPLRKCSNKKFNNRLRPCLNQQIGQCFAPCGGNADPEKYQKIVRQVKLFFEGKAELLTTEMKAEMEQASEDLAFEKAAKLRDAIYAIQATVERQKVVSDDFIQRDVYGLYREGGSAVVSILYLRNGAILGHRAFPVSNQELPDEEIIASIVKQYYGEENLIPKEIIVGADLGEEGNLIESWLSEVAERKVPITLPIRGRKKDLLLLAEKNALSQFEMSRSQIIDGRQVLEKIQRRLHLVNYPHQIECFDISNIQGAFPVASQVRFTDGDPDKNGYRHYKIKTVVGQDDFASMKEVLTRRFLKTQEEAPWPDLLMIDGGKGQLNIALTVMAELSIEGPDVIGFTKIRKPGKEEAEDMAYLPGRKNPVHFRKGGDDLFLLQRVRDESHRFAIEFHRKLRAKHQRKSILDEIEGIGPAKKKSLLKHFGSVKRITAATPEQLEQVTGINRELAEKIHRILTELNGG